MTARPRGVYSWILEPDPVTPSWLPRSPSRWSLTLPKDVGAVRTARASVEQWLEQAPPRVRDDARSIVTELVANAVRYGRAPIQVKLERKASHWMLEVADGGLERARRASPSASPGWGLRIVDALAESWGTGENGSRVWCRLPAPRRRNP